ncbi:ribonuclease YeeF family protein [Metabacillus sp. Hm71]|uniref:ribonuclease YeeF family protein n=1 Tax=Metabacillus sp. Hm71 TaxID=3450743 RepID=UPI003F4224C2
MVKVLDTKTLLHTMEARSQEYKNLREQLEQVKRKCNDIVNLGDQFQGKGADAIKGFYQAQIDVAEAWLRLIDRHIAFLNGINGSTEEKDLANSVVHLPFLEDELVHHIRNQKEMVASQQEELRKIFNRIDDLISLDPFSTNRFEEQIEQADKDRKATVDAVNQLDEELNSEYRLSEGDEQFVIALFQQLMEASRQGNTISPIQFNLDAYQASEVYKLKGQAEQQTKDYLSFKNEQEAFRAQLKRQEELENRPWYEKAWDGIKTFTGEFTGYYDYIRASEGVDPVTGEKLTAGQRVAAGAMAAAGFIPIVGWAGRIVKGGGAIYKTAKGMHAADQALDVYKTTKTFSNLEKAEMGLYGLVSANGFSEYITGKDMFGNELTEEQRQASLLQSVVGSSLIAAPFVPQLVKNGKMIREETISKAHELAARTKADLRFVMDEVRGGFHVLRNGMYPNNLAFAANSSVQKVPLNVMNSGSVKRELDGVLSKFSYNGVNKGTEKIQLGKEDLDALRNKWNVPETHTIAVGKTDVKGLEDLNFEGGSPKVRKEAGLPDLDVSHPDRPIKSSGKIPSATRHAEEGVANQFVEAVEKARIKPEDVVGTLRLHQSNPSGVCPTCLSGLGNPKKNPGIIKQLSLKYPNLSIEVTSEIVEGAKVNGRLTFKVKNGVYID